MKLKKKIPTGQVVLHAVFIFFMICYIVPIAMCISVSLTDETALVTNGYSLIPSQFSFEAYRLVFRDPTQILNSYRTTIIFTATATVLAVIVMALLAYPLARPQYKLRSFLNFYVFFTMLFSGGMVPSYLLISKYLGWKDNIIVYIIPSLVSAYNVMIIRTNFASLPYELTEAAKLDGASELRTCFQIVMPLCKPVLASIAFLFMVAKWNDWMTSMLYIRESELWSLQYLLQKILQEAEFVKQMAEQGELIGDYVFPSESFRYAMAIVAAGPVLVVFPFFQKYFSKGMTLGGVKG